MVEDRLQKFFCSLDKMPSCYKPSLPSSLSSSAALLNAKLLFLTLPLQPKLLHTWFPSLSEDHTKLLFQRK